MAGGLALPPASAGRQGNDAQDETQSTLTQADIDAFIRDNDVFDDPTFGGTGMMNDNVLNEFPFNADFPADFTADEAFGGFTPQQTAPMQQQNPVQAPMPMHPPMAPMAPMPDMSLGPSYDPRIGWYYPAPAPANYPPPPPPMPFPMPQEGFTPSLATTPNTSAMPSGTSTPVPPAAPAGRRDRKPKYGPAAYLNQQANKANTSSDHPRAVSISQAEYTSQAKRRDDRTNGTSTTKFARKRTAPSVVQVCICSDKQAQKVKRPKNAFILFRSAMAHKIMKQAGNRSNQNVSTQAARMWKSATPAVKKQFQDLALEEVRRHKEMYPDYVYQPGLTNRNKFGSASCKCGAYQANIAALKARKEAELNSLGVSDDEAEAEELDEYIPPRSQQTTQQQASPAPMGQYPLPDPSTFGFATATQQAEAQEYVNNMKRKRDAATTYPEPEDTPVTKRRGLRSGKGSVSYAEPSDGDIEDDIFGIGGQTKLKKRPSAIATSPGVITSTLATAPEDPVLFEDSPPALNTRARSRSRSRSNASIDWNNPELFDFNADPNIDFDNLFNEGLFGGALNEGQHEDDNIIVASGSRRSSGKKSPTRTYDLRRSPRNSRPSTRGNS